MTTARIFAFFIIGFCIGFIMIDLLSRDPIIELEINYDYGGMVAPDSSMDKVKKVRILCVITTSEKNHHLKAIHVHNTWAKHCDKVFFSSGKTDNNLDSINFDVSDEYDYLWGKVKMIMQFVHKHFMNDYDWVYKGDDDTFAILENMRYLLATYSPDDPIYFGHKFNTSQHKFGYFSGGAGYVLSKRALKKFVEEILIPNKKDFCKSENDKANEDWEMGLCMDKIGVYPMSDQDAMKRTRFLPLPLEHHMDGWIPDWYTHRTLYYDGNDSGLDCCSNYTISSHYVKPSKMYSNYFFAYHLRSFGIHRNFPPLARERSFSKVIRNLLPQ